MHRNARAIASLGTNDHGFDRLTRFLTRAGTRRQGLRAALAAGIALVATASGRDIALACLPNGRRCGRKSGAKGRGCGKCCSRFAIAEGRRQRCSCKPEATPCNNPSQCCGGLCNNGICAGFD
jgi:hypothetical protein